MKKFLFEFEAVLRLRRSERARCRQSLGLALRDDAELIRLQHEIEERRLAQIDELRRMETVGGLDVEASRARRVYVSRLADDLAILGRKRDSLAEAIKLHRRDLLSAEQAVESLEKLSARRKIEFDAQEQRRETLASEEAWHALHHPGRIDPEPSLEPAR